MRSEYNRYRLADIIDIIGGGTPKTTITEYWNGDIPWLSVKDFNNDERYVYKTEKSITQLGLENSSTKLLLKDDIIISARGTVGELAMIPFPMAFNQSCYGIRGKGGIVTQTYLYYLLKNSIALLKSITHGSVFDTITRDTFYNIEVTIPSLEKQNRVTEILVALDNKIENNSAINRCLEKILRVIYKSWFVDFEPFQEEGFIKSELGDIPKGWNVMPLTRFCNLISRGIAPKYIEFGEHIVLNQKCIRDHQVNFAPARCHLPKVINEKWLQYGDVLVNSTGQGTLGRVAQWLETSKNVTVDSHISIVRPSEKYYIYYIGQFLMAKEREIESMAAGSTGQTELSRERLGSLLLLHPKIEQLEKFSEIVEPLMTKIVVNNHESEKLAKIRDVLIPKLLSGEFPISNEGLITNERSSDNDRTR